MASIRPSNERGREGEGERGRSAACELTACGFALASRRAARSGQAIFSRYLPLLAASLDARHRGIQPHGACGQPCGDRIDEARQAIAQRDEHTVPGAALFLWCGRPGCRPSRDARTTAGSSPIFHLMPHRADQTTEIAFHLAKSRQRGQHAQLLQIGGIDRADQRFYQPLERLAAQTAADEIGHALVGLIASRRDEVFQPRPQFAQRTQQRRDRQRPKPRGGHHQESVRQPVQPPVIDHERAPPGWVRADELLAQPQPLAEIQSPGDGGDEVVGALFDLKPLLMHRRNNAAQPRTRLEKRQLAVWIEFHQPMRRRHTRDATANDCDAPANGFRESHEGDFRGGVRNRKRLRRAATAKGAAAHRACRAGPWRRTRESARNGIAC